jgi:formamidopyrimidine-DNA glycosylase
MPELPEVETVVRDLERLIMGGQFVRGSILRARNLSTPDVATFSDAIAGRIVEGLRRRAKWILIDLSGGLTLLVHLRMTGQVLVVSGSNPIDPYIRARLELADGREVRFRDVRAFGRLALVARRDDGTPARTLDPNDPPLLADQGVEPLDASFTTATLQSLLAKKRGRIKPLLLDQRVIAGIGNIYADETLWRARIHPAQSVDRLPPAKIADLHGAIVSVLAEAVASRGSSIDDYTAPEGDGTMQERLAVYQRTGAPCLRCAAPIRRAVIGGRGTHFCGTCQRSPKGFSLRASSSGVTPTRRGPRWADRLHPDAAGATRTERAAARRRAARGEGATLSGGRGAAA